MGQIDEEPNKISWGCFTTQLQLALKCLVISGIVKQEMFLNVQYNK